MKITLFLSLAATAFLQGKSYVLILVDDLGYMDIGAYNPKSFYETPNIDRLAKSGLKFTDGYAANPVCSPTRFGIQTGRYPTRKDCTNFFSGRRGGKFACAPLHDRLDHVLSWLHFTTAWAALGAAVRRVAALAARHGLPARNSGGSNRQPTRGGGPDRLRSQSTNGRLTM